MIGQNTPAASKAILWTDIMQGHRVLAEPYALLEAARVIIKGAQDWGFEDDYARMHEELGIDGAIKGPFAVLWKLLPICGMDWPETLVIRGTADGRMLWLKDNDIAFLLHFWREKWRITVQTRAPHRFDMPEVMHEGVNGKRCRQLADTGTISAFQKGILRVLQVGASWHPSRRFFAGKLSEQDAQCRLCQGELDMLGHRFWRCPYWDDTKARLSVDATCEPSLPKCLSRCGLVPNTCELRKAEIFNIQRMLVSITHAYNEKFPEQSKSSKCCAERLLEAGVAIRYDGQGHVRAVPGA